MSAKPLALHAGLAQEINFGVEKTFSCLFALSTQMGKARVEQSCVMRDDVCGLMKLVQDRTEGAMYISFPRATIFGVVGKLFNKEFTEIDGSVRSGVGEITNSVFGVLKSNLKKSGFDFKMDVPDVIVGGREGTMIEHASHTMVIPFMTDLGPFTVMITVYPAPTQKREAA